MELSVIIPAKNEEKNIEGTIRSVHGYLTSRNISHEIIVATNNCTDKTDEIVDRLAKEFSQVIHIHPEKCHGKGCAVKQGLLTGTGQVRLFMDADNSTTIDNLERFKAEMAKGYDVVIASIALKGAKVMKGSEPAWRRIFGKMGNLYIQLFAVPGIWDTQRGFKVMTGEAADKIFSKVTIDGFGFDIEMLALARKFGYKIKELAIHWHNDPESNVGLNAYFQVLREALTVRWNLMTGRYK